MSSNDWKKLSLRDKLDYLSALEDKASLREGRAIDRLYPDSGLLSRDKYTKHLEFFAAGKMFNERGAIAGNRTGKTTMSCYETTLHLTGQYPDWWPGRRFNRPVEWWGASDTTETTRDILQKEMLGPPGHFGTGMIPRELIAGEPTGRRGVTGAVDTIAVKHVSGGISTYGLKSYDQGRTKFQGTKKDGIDFDEEPPDGVYFEGLTRLTATVPGEESGLMKCTFTPLKGMSAVVLMYLNDQSPTRFIMTMGMIHAPHLDKETRDRLIASFPPHEREARMNGTPQLGSGAIYTTPVEDIVIPDFKIEDHWLKGYSMDVGWNRTSVGWHAFDSENDVIYRFAEHYRGQAEPSIHADAIKAKGDWIEGVIDPAARGRSQIDGSRLIQIYQDLGLKLTPAKNAVEAGIYEMQQRLATGRYLVFASCQNFQAEYRLYRRDEKGKIVKERDHAMDDARYYCMSGVPISRAKPQPPKPRYEFRTHGEDNGWMG